ncbi:hypothetical protein LXL04_004330 [Taraxacum kok-saghyz]
MDPFVFIIFSLLLLNQKTTIAKQLNKCLDEERHALLHFKSRLQDPDSVLSTWIANEHDCCKWRRITCNNKTGRVTELDINNYNIGGEISNSLLNLSYLSYLDLSGNSFHGAIPTIIGSLTRLKYLNLGYNNLNGTIPKSIGSLIELRNLDLSYTSLYGTIPPELGNLTNLQTLSLGSNGGCRVENLEWLSTLSHLEELDMSGVSLAKANHWVNVVSSLQKLSQLSLWGCELSQVMYPYSSFVNSSSYINTLDLGDNNLTSSMYHWLFLLTNNKLRSLELSRNLLDGIPKYVGNLCSLETLTLGKNSAVVIFPDFLKNLSGCTSLTLQDLSARKSQLVGSLSDDIHKFSSLEYLYLSENKLNGSISGKLLELPKLLSIDLSENSLQGIPSNVHVSNISYSHVEYTDISSCKLGPHFPKWIQTLKNVTHLDISNNGISDTIPLGFGDTWASQLTHLNLSFNNISGKLLDLSSNFDDQAVIDLSRNNFYGPIPNVSSTLVSLNLSKNKFYGGVSFLCQIVDGFLSFLDLSHNSLTGQLPDCLWHFKELQVLNLGHNNLSGRLPPSIESLIKLKVLYLYNNKFSGEFPLSFKNCTSLNSFNLGANKFSGNVPVWIGENFSGLYVLILRSNNFFGTIPSNLCRLANIRILDFSMNNLHGSIPSCLNNFTSMVQERFSQEQDIDYIMNLTHGMDHSYMTDTYVNHAMIQWQGVEREFFSNLKLLKSIDLSSNNLTGRIPYEVTALHELVALNLSKNALLGEIPRSIGQMAKLLTLDLSRNKFSGGIPSSMTQMTFLSYIDVSYNNLFGRIPSSTQLQSFESSRYEGNVGLCGPPLTMNCPGDEELKVPSDGESEGDGEGVDELWGWFYMGGGIGFATGFLMACGILIVNRRGRQAFSHFLNKFMD